MTRETPTAWDRNVIAACATGAVAFALANSFLLRAVMNNWVTAALLALPACLALAAVVLTAVAPAGTAIVVPSGVVAVVANLRSFDPHGSMLGVGDYLSWAAWAVVIGCSLLVADAMAWRLGRFSPQRGAVAGLLVAVVAAVLKLALDTIGPGFISLGHVPLEYWLTVYVLPSAMLVAVGALAGATVARQRAGLA